MNNEINVTIEPRSAWGAAPPQRAYTSAGVPWREAILHHTAAESFGPAGVRAAQRTHQDERGWNDIGYQVIVDPVGLRAYEGRPINVEGAHTKGRNDVAAGIAVLGDFTQRVVTAEAIELLAEVMAYGRLMGWWSSFLTGVHGDYVATACPGVLKAAVPQINSRAGVLYERAQMGDLGPDPADVESMLYRMFPWAQAMGDAYVSLSEVGDLDSIARTSSNPHGQAVAEAAAVFVEAVEAGHRAEWR